MSNVILKIEHKSILYWGNNIKNIKIKAVQLPQLNKNLSSLNRY